VHIDPYRNETSRFADEHWAIRVGTDTALALAIGGEILRLGLEDRDYLDQYANDLADYRDACAEWPVAKAAEYCGIPRKRFRELAQAIGRSGQPLSESAMG
jgi:anaerobic selenocysteine-containing dehydrogenase